MNHRKRKRKRQTFKQNIKDKKRRCIDVVNNQKEYENKNNDDNCSFVTTLSNTTNNTIKTLSTRNLKRMEWNLYRDAFQIFYQRLFTGFIGINLQLTRSKSGKRKYTSMMSTCIPYCQKFPRMEHIRWKFNKRNLWLSFEITQTEKTGEYKWLRFVQNTWNITKKNE